MNKVSIIIPVYNVEKYLEECVQSVLSQTYGNYEIILVDDGSTDKSGAICDSYANQDNVKIIHKENGGLSSARNTGIAMAEGNLLFFVDTDDYISEDALEIMTGMYTNTGADIVVAQYSPKAEDLSHRKQAVPAVFDSQKALKWLLQERISPSASAKLYKAEMFDDIRFPEGMIYEDYATIPRIIGKARTVAVTDNCVYYYRENPQSITGVSFSPGRMQFFDVADSIIEYLKNKNKHLIKWADMRHTRYAISFFRQIAKSGFNDENIEKALVHRIRKNIVPYCIITRYSILSRLYGALIAMSPKAARRLMK